MRILVTGAGGLVGSAVSEISARLGHDVVAVENNFRGRFLDGDVRPSIARLRNFDRIKVFDENIACSIVDHIEEVDAIVHCAGQPSHDFSVKSPQIDYRANVDATAAILHAHKFSASKPKIVFLSTNKVYGDLINKFLFIEDDERFVLPSDDPIVNGTLGINEDFPIEPCARTPFGASKLASDFMVQEWAHTYGAQTVVFRCGCITGSSGSPVEVHGFLGYLVKCAVANDIYRVYGYNGFQVRDNIAAVDLASAILLWLHSPKGGVYNMGGGSFNSLSVREAIKHLHSFGFAFLVDWDQLPRFADHKWWITNTARFEQDFPSWKRQIDVQEVLHEMVRCELRGGKSSPGYEAISSRVVEEVRFQLQQSRTPVESTGQSYAIHRDVPGSRYDGWPNS